MNIAELTNYLNEMKETFEQTISTATFTNKKGELVSKENGHQAKEALIRSSTLINNIHEAVKKSINHKLTEKDFTGYKIHPPIGQSAPELDVWGFLKKKKQDIVITFGPHEKKEKITKGPLKNQVDQLGREVTNKSIVIGVRSQLSSISNNYDTLMERTFAEAINLHNRHPKVTMGEVYLLIVKEYDKEAMKKNEVAFVNNYTKLEKFISIFNAISHRKCTAKRSSTEAYKYEATALLLVDFSQSPVKLYTTLEELKADGIVSKKFKEDFTNLSPIGFSDRLLDCYIQRHRSE